MPAQEDSWSDEAAGPVVRPFALIRGRTRPSGAGDLDLLAVITATAHAPGDAWTLGPEHIALLGLCASPVPLADLASSLDLPLGVVRVLVADLRELDLVSVRRATTTQWRDDDLPILREVINGLRQL